MSPATAAGTEPFSALPFVTPAAWAAAQVPHAAELLVEQAHLEKKAAAAAISFLFRLPADAAVHRELSALAREELVHFERTLRLLEKRGVALCTLAPSPYAERLKSAIASATPQRLADELIVAAIIEERSCERMALLAQALAATDAESAAFYADLHEAETRHRSLYLELATTVVPLATVAQRWREIGAHEAALLRELPQAPRLHSGVAVAASAS